MSEEHPHQKATVVGMLIGVGMGGFVDGMVRHQIAQWHHMRSNIVPPHTMDTMRVNMTWDVIFHALTWLVTLVGILRLRSAATARAAMPSLQVFTGQLILGWGVFNLVEGVIDHQILAIHHVREVPNDTVYSLTFLAIGGVLLPARLAAHARGKPSRGGGSQSTVTSPLVTNRDKAPGCRGERGDI